MHHATDCDPQLLFETCSNRLTFFCEILGALHLLYTNNHSRIHFAREGRGYAPRKLRQHCAYPLKAKAASTVSIPKAGSYIGPVGAQNVQWTMCLSSAYAKVGSLSTQPLARCRQTLWQRCQFWVRLRGAKTSHLKYKMLYWVQTRSCVHATPRTCLAWSFKREWLFYLRPEAFRRIAFCCVLTCVL
jgi:hypothetical protein